MAAIERTEAPQHDLVRSRKVGMKAGLIVGLCTALIASASPASAQSSGQSSLDTLHQALDLSPRQEAAWHIYSANISAPSRTQDRRRAASQMFPNLSAPQRMDLVEAEMKQELVDLQRQSAALKAFYMTLNMAQKSTFDAQTLPPPDSQPPPGQ